MAPPTDPDVTDGSDQAETPPAEFVDTAAAGEEPQASLPPAVEAAVELDATTAPITADLSGLSNY